MVARNLSTHYTTVEEILSTTVSFVKMLSIMTVDRKNEAKDIHIGFFFSLRSSHFPASKNLLS